MSEQYDGPGMAQTILKLRAEVATLKEALEKLANEAQGFLSMANVVDHGRTNMVCLEHRIQLAYKALRLNANK